MLALRRLPQRLRDAHGAADAAQVLRAPCKSVRSFYNMPMVRHVEAIFSRGVFRPLQPLALPEGTRVQLSVEEQTNSTPVAPAAKILSPKLAHSKDTTDFRMEVRETGDAGV
jgi:predicted DNA-binding antitoxin AbrB/MazE fold protein